jgi:hypothetical protein
MEEEYLPLALAFDIIRAPAFSPRVLPSQRPDHIFIRFF